MKTGQNEKESEVVYFLFKVNTKFLSLIYKELIKPNSNYLRDFFFVYLRLLISKQNIFKNIWFEEMRGEFVVNCSKKDTQPKKKQEKKKKNL